MVPSMNNSILHFSEEGIKNLEAAQENLAKHPEDLASYVEAVKSEVINLGLEIIKETLETFDELLRDSSVRKEHWEIVRKDEKQLITSLGTVCFGKTLFREKESKKSKYLVDDFLCLEKHQRMTDDAVASLLTEAVETSYRKGGIATSINDAVSKETVKDIIHELKFPKLEKPKKKKQVDYLYIDADEDHVSLQFQNVKGDLERDARGYKKNNVIAKLIYVYEGIEKDAPESKRHHLVNPHYFCGMYEGSNNEKLWDQVYEYIDAYYEIDKIKKIYLNADGGAWIKAGKKRIKGITYVLDEFHMRKYLTKMTHHMLDSAEEIREILCNTIKNGTKEDFREGIDTLVEYEDTLAGKNRIREAGEYFLSNWSAAKVRLTNRTIVKGCSAEGHVSHILSARMSSRPMGWSRLGVDQMSHLRAYVWNGGDMLELARYQKAEQKEEREIEKPILSYRDAIKDMYMKKSQTAIYAEKLQCNLSTQLRHTLSQGMHSYIWHLM